MASTSRWTRWLALLLVVQLALAEISIRNVYVEQVIVVTNGTSVPTLRTQISVSCNSGDSQFFTSIINSSLTNVMITCSPTQIIQSVIQERWANVQAKTVRLEAVETLQLINSEQPYYVTLAAVAFNESMQFSNVERKRGQPRYEPRAQPNQRAKRGQCDAGTILGNPHLPSTGGNTDAACFAGTMTTWAASCAAISALPGQGWCGVVALSTVMQTLLYDDSSNVYTDAQINAILNGAYTSPTGGQQSFQACDFVASSGLGVSRLRGCLLTIINSVNLLEAQIKTTQEQVQTLLEISTQQQANFNSLTAQVTEINQNLATQASITAQAAYAQELTVAMVNTLASQQAVQAANQDQNNANILTTMQGLADGTAAMGINLQAEIEFMTDYQAAQLTLVEQQIYVNVYAAIANMQAVLQSTNEGTTLDIASMSQQLQDQLNVIGNQIAFNNQQIEGLMELTGNLVRAYGDVVNNLATTGVLPLYVVAAYQQFEMEGLLPFVADYGIPIPIMDELYNYQTRNWTWTYPQICNVLTDLCRTCSTPITSAAWYNATTQYYAENAVVTWGVSNINDYSYPQYSDTVLLQAQVNGQWYYLTTTCTVTCSANCPNFGSFSSPAVCITNSLSSATQFIIQNYNTYESTTGPVTKCAREGNTQMILSDTNTTVGGILTETITAFYLGCDPAFLATIENLLYCNGTNLTRTGVIQYNVTCLDLIPVFDDPTPCILFNNNTFPPGGYPTYQYCWNSTNDHDAVQGTVTPLSLVYFRGGSGLSGYQMSAIYTAGNTATNALCMDNLGGLGPSAVGGVFLVGLPANASIQQQFGSISNTSVFYLSPVMAGALTISLGCSCSSPSTCGSCCFTSNVTSNLTSATQLRMMSVRSVATQPDEGIPLTPAPPVRRGVHDMQIRDYIDYDEQSQPPCATDWTQLLSSQGLDVGLPHILNCIDQNPLCVLARIYTPTTIIFTDGYGNSFTQSNVQSLIHATFNGNCPKGQPDLQPNGHFCLGDVTIAQCYINPPPEPVGPPYTIPFNVTIPLGLTWVLTMTSTINQLTRTVQLTFYSGPYSSTFEGAAITWQIMPASMHNVLGLGCVGGQENLFTDVISQVMPDITSFVNVGQSAQYMDFCIPSNLNNLPILTACTYGNVGTGSSINVPLPSNVLIPTSQWILPVNMATLALTAGNSVSNNVIYPAQQQDYFSSHSFLGRTCTPNQAQCYPGQPTSPISPTLLPQLVVNTNFYGCFSSCSSIMNDMGTCENINDLNCVWASTDVNDNNACYNICQNYTGLPTNAFCKFTSIPAPLYSCNTTILNQFYHDVMRPSIGFLGPAYMTEQALCAATQGIVGPDGTPLFSGGIYSQFTTNAGGPLCVWDYSESTCINYDRLTSYQVGLATACNERLNFQHSTQADCTLAPLAGTGQSYSYQARCAYVLDQSVSAQAICIPYSVDDSPVPPFNNPLDEESYRATFGTWPEVQALYNGQDITTYCRKPNVVCNFEGCTTSNCQYQGTLDWYQRSGNISNLLFPCSAYSNTDTPGGCVLKTYLNGKTIPECIALGDVCTPNCDFYNNNGPGCIGSPAGSGAVPSYCYYIATNVTGQMGQCIPLNTIPSGSTVATLPACQIANAPAGRGCGVTTHPCYIYPNSSVSACAANPLCTYLNNSAVSSAAAPQSSYCEQKTLIDNVQCKNSSVSPPFIPQICYITFDALSTTTLEALGPCNVQPPPGQTYQGAAFFQACFNLSDTTTTPVVSCQVGQFSTTTQSTSQPVLAICFSPNSDRFQQYQVQYPYLTGQAISNTTYYASLYPRVTYYTMTFVQLQQTVLRNPSIFSLTNIRLTNLTTQPTNTFADFTNCLESNYTSLGDRCCLTSELAANGGNCGPTFYINPFAPNVVFQNIYAFSTAGCANETQANEVVDITTVSWPQYVMGISQDSPIYEDDLACTVFQNDTSFITSDNYTLAPYVLLDMLIRLNIMPTITNWPCVMEYTDLSNNTLGPVTWEMGRLAPNAWAQAQSFFQWTVYDGATTFNLTQFGSILSNIYGGPQDFSSANITGADTWAAILGRMNNDLQFVQDKYAVITGADPRLWTARLPTGIQVTNEYLEGLDPTIFKLQTKVGYLTGVSPILTLVNRVASSNYLVTATLELMDPVTMQPEGTFVASQTSSWQNLNDVLLPQLRDAWTHFNGNVTVSNVTNQVIYSPPFSACEPCSQADWCWASTSGYNDLDFNYTIYTTRCPTWDNSLAFPPPISLYACPYNPALGGYQWTSSLFGTTPTNGQDLQAVLALNILFNMQYVGPDGNLLWLNWQTLFMSANASQAEVLQMFQRLSVIWSGQYFCPNGLYNFIPTTDGTPNVNGTFDIIYQCWQYYSGPANFSAELTFEAILLPFVTAPPGVANGYCGLCGINFGTICWPPFVLQSFDAQYSCTAGGMGLAANFYTITQPSNTVYVFSANSGTQTQDNIFTVNQAVTALAPVLTTACPVAPPTYDTPFNCYPLNGAAVCSVLLVNTLSAAGMEVTIVVNSTLPGCGQTRTASIGPLSLGGAQFTLCANDTVVISVFSFGNYVPGCNPVATPNICPPCFVSQPIMYSVVIVSSESLAAQLIPLSFNTSTPLVGGYLALVNQLQILQNGVIGNSSNFTVSLRQVFSQVANLQDAFQEFIDEAGSSIPGTNGTLISFIVAINTTNTVISKLLGNGTPIVDLGDYTEDQLETVIENSLIAKVILDNATIIAQQQAALAVANWQEQNAQFLNQTNSFNILAEDFQKFAAGQNSAVGIVNDSVSELNALLIIAIVISTVFVAVGAGVGGAALKKVLDLVKTQHLLNQPATPDEIPLYKAAQTKAAAIPPQAQPAVGYSFLPSWLGGAPANYAPVPTQEIPMQQLAPPQQQRAAPKYVSRPGPPKQPFVSATKSARGPAVVPKKKSHNIVV